MKFIKYSDKYDNNVNIGRIALYGSTELTLPDDSTHPPDSIYILVSDDISLLNSIFFNHLMEPKNVNIVEVGGFLCP